MRKDTDTTQVMSTKELVHGHNLIIESLHDGMAKCSCGRWSLSRTGRITKREIEGEYKKHVEGVPGDYEILPPGDYEIVSIEIAHGYMDITARLLDKIKKNQ